MSSSEPPNPVKTKGRNFFDRLASFFHEDELNDRDAVVATLKEARRRNLIDDDALSMMEGSLRVSEIRAGELMVPRSQVQAVNLSEPREVWLPKMIATGHSRFPAVRDDLDNVLGLLHAKDLLKLLVHPDADVEKLLRPVRYIPETQPINMLLHDFKATRTYLALVIDEFGSVSGLITIEDVLEQIVGEISDEFDRDDSASSIVADGPARWKVRAVTPLEQFNEYFGTDFEDPYCETIGGLVTDRFEHVPHRGEVIEEKGFRFRVLDGDDRQATLLSVEKTGKPGKKE
ncbi:MAG: CBS domain-containing protein [Burkholderia sp.]|jgi:magnesium and cobalt transporter